MRGNDSSDWDLNKSLRGIRDSVAQSQAKWQIVISGIVNGLLPMRRPAVADSQERLRAGMMAQACLQPNTRLRRWRFRLTHM